MIIGLFGFSFIDRNRGCEALTYSFINILQELYPENLTIVNLSGSDISKVSKMYPKIKFEMVGFQKDKISVKSFTLLLLGSSANVIFELGKAFFNEIKVGRKNISSPIPPKFIASIFFMSINLL